MRIVLGWNNLSSDEGKLVEAILTCQRTKFLLFFEEILNYQIEASNISETWLATLDFAKKNKAHFFFLSHRSAWILDPARLFELLSLPSIQKAAVSVRAGQIVGKGFRFSPKFPYLDEDFIIINVRRCEELGIDKQLSEVNVHSHFESQGGIHATFVSFLEAVLPSGEVFVYSDGSDCQNMFGEWNGFQGGPPLYLYSQRFGFLSASPSLEPRLHELRAALLSMYNVSDGGSIVDAYKIRYGSQKNGRMITGQPFFCQPICQRVFSTILQPIKLLLNKINFEIQKKYEADRPS